MAFAEKLPTRYVTKRESIHKKIAALQTRQDSAQREANNVNVSTTGVVYSSLTESTGLTVQGVSATAAIMLSVTPIVLGIGFAALSSRRKTVIEAIKADRGKSSQGDYMPCNCRQTSEQVRYCHRRLLSGKAGSNHRRH